MELEFRVGRSSYTVDYEVEVGENTEFVCPDCGNKFMFCATLEIESISHPTTSKTTSKNSGVWKLVEEYLNRTAGTDGKICDSCADKRLLSIAINQDDVRGTLESYAEFEEKWEEVVGHYSQLCDH